MLDSLLTNDVFMVGLVFARIGSAVMLLPGFAESFVSARIRLMFGLGLSLVVTPAVSQFLPPVPHQVLPGFGLVAGEIVVGLFLGAVVRLMVTSLHVAGVVIGFQTGLANASFFDPAEAQQGSVIAAFLNLVGIFLIFVSDLHHLMLMAIADSYTMFKPGAPIPFGDMSQVVVQTLGHAFSLGIQLAAPFIVVAIVFYAGLGLLGRLMPQIQFFFIAVPLQIILSFSILAMTLSAGMMWFLSNFQDSLMRFTGQS